MKKWKQLIMSFALVLGIGGVLVSASPAMAINVFKECGSGNNSDSAVCQAQDEDDLPDMVQIIINTILVILGMIAVIMIVIGGIRYTTSNGDSAAVKSAKDTILYAVVGLVVAILSYAIVNFVVDRFVKGE
jgi:hypothetical protein